MISPDARGASTSSGTAPDALYDQLAQGLHAAAQPLTILLASLSEGHTQGMNVAELRELIASSAIEVRRVCNVFTRMQQLVMAHGSAQSSAQILAQSSALEHATVSDANGIATVQHLRDQD